MQSHFLLNQIIQAIDEKKHDVAKKRFIELLHLFAKADTQPAFNDYTITGLYQLDKKLDDNADLRREIFANINQTSINTIASPYREFIEEIHSPKKYGDDYRLLFLKKIYHEFRNHIGVICVYATAMSEEALEQKDQKKLKTCLKLFESCGSQIDNCQSTSISRLNTILYLTSVLSENAQYDEVTSIFENASKETWYKKSELANCMVPIPHMYTVVKHLNENFSKSIDHAHSKITEEISDQKLKLIETMTIFIALMGILGLTLYSLNGNGQWHEKSLFLIEATLKLSE
jgi:hypothetical protein